MFTYLFLAFQVDQCYHSHAYLLVNKIPDRATDEISSDTYLLVTSLLDRCSQSIPVLTYFLLIFQVDLCNPSRCESATECIDYGHTFSCTCNPGYMGKAISSDL